jgi:hypothetical protein
MDQHILWRHAKGAFIVIMGTWIVLTAMYFGMHYWVDTYPHGEEPWLLEALDGFFENLQSEAWQVGFAAWAFKHFIYEGSPESKE